MTRILAALMLTAALALTASAEERFSSPPVRHVSAGTFHSGARPAAAPGVAPHLGPAGSGSAFAPTRFARPSGGFAPHAFAGGGAMLQPRNNSFWGHGRMTLAHWMFTRDGLRRVDGSSGSGGTTTTAQQPTPGSFGTVPGALLRSEGVGFLYAPGDSGRFTVVDAGNRIALQDNLATATSGMGVHVGPADTPPGTNGTASGVTAITPNSPADNSSISNSVSNTTIDNGSSGSTNLSGDIHDYGNHNGNGNGNF